MTRKSTRKKRRSPRRTYSDELKAEAVQMMLDGHSAQSVVGCASHVLAIAEFWCNVVVLPPNVSE